MINFINFFLFLLLITAKPSVARHIDFSKEFLKSSEYSGTPSRTETELKLAYEITEKIPLKEIKALIVAIVQESIANKEFRFSQQVLEQYYLNPEFQSFAFLDYYYDSRDWKLFQNKAVYRLRYRWSQMESYLRHHIFPFLKIFHPTRCEIQLKYAYQKAQQENTLQVQESRFEFRNESNPFITHQDAPPPPWPFKDYNEIAKAGKFKQHPIGPFQDMIQYLKPKNISELKDFTPQFQVLTFRHRNHLNIQQPWGTGPNPQQAFILTIDESQFKRFPPEKNKTYSKKFLEIEIEIERNVSTEIERLALLEDEDERVTNSSAKSFSQKAKKNLEHDLNIIYKKLHARLSTLLKKNNLKATNKYSRFVQHVQQ